MPRTGLPRRACAPIRRASAARGCGPAAGSGGMPAAVPGAGSGGAQAHQYGALAQPGGAGRQRGCPGSGGKKLTNTARNQGGGKGPGGGSPVQDPAARTNAARKRANAVHALTSPVTRCWRSHLWTMYAWRVWPCLGGPCRVASYCFHLDMGFARVWGRNVRVGKTHVGEHVSPGDVVWEVEDMLAPLSNG